MLRQGPDRPERGRYNRRRIQEELTRRAHHPARYVHELRYGPNHAVVKAIKEPDEPHYAIGSPDSVLIFVTGGLGLYSYVMLPWRRGTHENPYVSKEIVFTDMCNFGGPGEVAAAPLQTAIKNGNSPTSRLSSVYLEERIFPIQRYANGRVCGFAHAMLWNFVSMHCGGAGQLSNWRFQASARTPARCYGSRSPTRGQHGTATLRSEIPTAKWIIKRVVIASYPARERRMCGTACKFVYL
jgi:hypothetical protein